MKKNKGPVSVLTANFFSYVWKDASELLLCVCAEEKEVFFEPFGNLDTYRIRECLFREEGHLEDER